MEKPRKPYCLVASDKIGKRDDRINLVKMMFSPGSANATLAVTDDLDGTGTIILKASCKANGEPIVFPLTRLKTAGYATITGSGASLTVWTD